MSFPLNYVDSDWTLDQLFACFAQAQVHIVDIHLTARWMEDPDEFPEMARQHLLYLWELERARKLFAAGPVEVANATDPVGMLVVVGRSRAEAETLAEQEPFHLSGWRRNTVRGWSINEGVAASTALLLRQLAVGGEIDRAGSLNEYVERLPASHAS